MLRAGSHPVATATQQFPSEYTPLSPPYHPAQRGNSPTCKCCPTEVENMKCTAKRKSVSRKTAKPTKPKNRFTKHPPHPNLRLAIYGTVRCGWRTTAATLWLLYCRRMIQISIGHCGFGGRLRMYRGRLLPRRPARNRPLGWRWQEKYASTGFENQLRAASPNLALGAVFSRS
jgi:hypothetical protein